MNFKNHTKKSFFNQCIQKNTINEMKKFNNNFFNVVDELQENETLTKEQKESLIYAKELLKQINKKI